MATPATSPTRAFTEPPTPPGAVTPRAGTPAPLGLVLLLTFLGSVGTGAVTNGIYFITDSGLGYGRARNLQLGVVFGLTYVFAALLAGPSLRRLARRSPRVTTRGVVIAILSLMGLICQLPILAQRTQPEALAPAIWVMVLVYAPASGVLWPIVERYLSGGRRGQALRTAIGRFNISWSAALVLAFWAMAPLLEHRPFWILSGLGVAHLLMGALALKLSREPAAHAEDHDDPAPASYKSLLTLCRALLFASYLVLSALGPLQPILLGSIGVAVVAQPLLASVWLGTRVVAFALLERWHAWHGRASAPWIGLAATVLGFTLAVASPMLVAETSNAAAIALFVVGLVLVGGGIAMIYCAALYYALAVGSDGVDAGGKHEAVIGSGYTLGPTIGLIALAMASPGDPFWGTTLDPDTFRWWTIALTALLAAAAGVAGWWASRRRP